jgi:putative transcriptional regulator
VFVIAAAACAIAVPVVLVMHADIIAELAKEAPKTANMQFVWALAGLLTAVAALLVAMWYFTRKLKQIVDSVAAGDPFIPENAERLKIMAWLSLALQFIAVPISVFGAWVGDEVQPENMDASISGNGLLHPRPRIPHRRADARRTGRDRVMPINVKLDDLLHARRMTLTELAERIDLTLANVSILKTGKAKAIRFSTLEAICRELDCQPGDVLGYEAESTETA